jgi:hypothetical protein
MALSMNRYIGNSILPLLIKHANFYNEAENYASLLDATLHTVYRYIQSAKYEFASSNTTRTTFAFDACFVWKLAPLADERSGFFIENLFVS